MTFALWQQSDEPGSGENADQSVCPTMNWKISTRVSSKGSMNSGGTPGPGGVNVAQFGTGSGLTTFSGINSLGSTTYHDVQVSYHWEDWRFTIGVDNITEKDPPVCTGCFANSYDPSVYRVPGRFPYLRVSKSF